MSEYVINKGCDMCNKHEVGLVEITVGKTKHCLCYDCMHKWGLDIIKYMWMNFSDELDEDGVLVDCNARNNTQHKPKTESGDFIENLRKTVVNTEDKEEQATMLKNWLGVYRLGWLSDGYHTFDELYHHRAVLFSVICNAYKDIAWKSKLHDDGTMFDGMFIVGIDTPDGPATYHYNIELYWDMFDVNELDEAPKWDGHTPEEAIKRISSLSSYMTATTSHTLDALSSYITATTSHTFDDTTDIMINELTQATQYFGNDISCKELIEKLVDGEVEMFYPTMTTSTKCTKEEYEEIIDNNIKRVIEYAKHDIDATKASLGMDSTKCNTEKYAKNCKLCDLNNTINSCQFLEEFMNSDDKICCKMYTQENK